VAGAITQRMPRTSPSPASRTTVGADLRGILVEISAVAYRPTAG